MKIQLEKWKVIDLNLSHAGQDSKDKNSFELNVGNHFPKEDDKNSFWIHFRLKVLEKSFELSLKAVFEFKLLDHPITEEFKLSTFPKVNGPAIAFPYLRAFVSTLTLQAGLKPVILPSINFIKLAENDLTVSGEEEE